MSSNRPEKVADLLKREISLILSQEVKDPRLQNINITAVKVTDDIGIAYLYYTVIGKSIRKSDSNIESKTLTKLAGMIRSKLSKIVKMRRVPKLIFKFDESISISDCVDMYYAWRIRSMFSFLFLCFCVCPQSLYCPAHIILQILSLPFLWTLF